MLREGRDRVLQHHRDRGIGSSGHLDVGQNFPSTDHPINRSPDLPNVMSFETGQGSALSAEAHHGVDQVTLEARAYGVARVFEPFLVNTVVGFIGPEYLYDERQIIRAG